MANEIVNCKKCKHFFITWEPAHPNGCRLFGFKSAKMPTVAVWESTGKQCEHFEPKQ